MPQTTYEALGDCYLEWDIETPTEFFQRTGEYMGGDFPPALGAIKFFIANTLSGEFADLAEARLHMRSLAKTSASYPIGRD